MSVYTILREEVEKKIQNYKWSFVANLDLSIFRPYMPMLFHLQSFFSIFISIILHCFVFICARKSYTENLYKSHTIFRSNSCVKENLLLQQRVNKSTFNSWYCSISCLYYYNVNIGVHNYHYHRKWLSTDYWFVDVFFTIRLIKLFVFA